jgi:hypothetical protein
MSWILSGYSNNSPSLTHLVKIATLKTRIYDGLHSVKIHYLLTIITPFVLTGVFILTMFPKHLEAATQIGLWDRFEASVTNSKTYTNPYNDVTLNVTYTKPNNSTVQFWGFYDGGTTWKIRFMPDMVGPWRYSAQFSDGTAGVSGTFDVIPSSIPGMLSQQEGNPQWFGYKEGNPELIRSFHVGDKFFASNWSTSERTAFLNWAQQTGYNMLSIASHYLNRPGSGRGTGWATPDLWPLNAGEWQEMEVILNDLAERKILIFPFAGFFGQSSDFPTNHADQERYIRYTLARIGAYWNITFNIAGPEPLAFPDKFQNAMTAVDIDRLGTLLKTLDVYNHPRTVHNGSSGSDPFKLKAWSTFSTLQGPKTTVTSTLTNGLLDDYTGNKAIYAQETLWYGNVNHPSYSDIHLRKNAYIINMSAVALNFADNLNSDGTKGNSSAGFSGSMLVSDVADTQTKHTIIKKVWDFFETVPFYEMAPCSKIGVTFSTGNCLAEPGKQYLLYLDNTRTVSVNTTGGPYAITWVNAQNTSDRRSGGTTTNGQNLTPPSGADDWLVYLTTTTTSTTTPPTPTGTPTPTPANEQTVVSLMLVNATTHADIMTLADGGIVDLATIPEEKFNIRAITNPETVGSIQFEKDGSVYRTENGTPYELEGDTGFWAPSLGIHSIKATPFSASSAGGFPGIPYQITFTVTNGTSHGDGDANDDGNVNNQDVVTILQNYLRSLSMPTDQFTDGRINVMDFVRVLKQLP